MPTGSPPPSSGRASPSRESRIGDGDIDDDGERIRYFFYDEDTNNNGLLDAGEDKNSNGSLDKGLLQRAIWDSAAAGYVTHTLITNVEALEFLYFDDEGNELVPALPASGACPGIPAGEISLYGDQLEDVYKVEITLVVHTTNEDYRFTDTAQYRNLQDEVVFNAATETVGDEKHMRRRAFTMSVQIRNNI